VELSSPALEVLASSVVSPPVLVLAAVVPADAELADVVSGGSGCAEVIDVVTPPPVLLVTPSVSVSAPSPLPPSHATTHAKTARDHRTFHACIHLDGSNDRRAR
jgi:hypothetical protein